MEFDQFTVVLLMLGTDAPEMAETDAEQLQAAHLAHLTQLHKDGSLIAAGPIMDRPDPSYRGICLYKTDAKTSRDLAELDPAVKAGQLSLIVLPWIVPSGHLNITSSLPLPSAD